MENQGVALEVKGLTKVFGQLVAVDHISFQVNRGELSVSWVPMAPAKPLPYACSREPSRMSLLIERLIEWTDNKRIGVSQEVEK